MMKRIGAGLVLAIMLGIVPPAVAYHDSGRCDYDECENGGQYGRRNGDGSDYGGNRRDDRNRNRGAFSPGPFDRSPIDFTNACISLDCSGRDDGKKRDDRSSEPGPSDS